MANEYRFETTRGVFAADEFTIRALAFDEQGNQINSSNLNITADALPALLAHVKELINSTPGLVRSTQNGLLEP